MCQRKKLRKTLPVAKLRDMSDEVASPKISVVVPVYRVEKYLRACVESVLAQSFRDFELILVDDGSPDKCGEICDELAKKDSRIRVFHQENRGGIAARKHGVERAHGEWITFVDSDDLLPKDALKKLIDEATDDIDWVQGEILRFKDGETPSEETRPLSVMSLDLIGLTENMLLHHPWPVAELFRRRLFSPHALEVSREIRLCVDTLTNLRLIANRPRKAKVISEVVYYYRRDLANSTTSSFVATEKYILRISRLFLLEIRKISEPNNRERLLCAFSQYLCDCVANLLAQGLPIKFPRRLAILIRRGVKTRPRNFFIYLCLRLSCPNVARTTSKIYHALHRRKIDTKGKILLS